MKLAAVLPLIKSEENNLAAQPQADVDILKPSGPMGSAATVRLPTLFVLVIPLRLLIQLGPVTNEEKNRLRFHLC